MTTNRNGGQPVHVYSVTVDPLCCSTRLPAIETHTDCESTKDTSNWVKALNAMLEAEQPWLYGPPFTLPARSNGAV